jgi:hypothetical protein
MPVHIAMRFRFVQKSLISDDAQCLNETNQYRIGVATAEGACTQRRSVQQRNALRASAVSAQRGAQTPLLPDVLQSYVLSIVSVLCE